MPRFIRLLLPAITLLSLFPGIVSAGTIRQDCSNKWGEDYRMIKYCISKQDKARDELLRYNGENKRNCANKWGSDYRMTLYCTKKQTKAEKSVKSSDRDEVSSACKSKWKSDYRMVQYCITKQRAARDYLNKNASTSAQRRSSSVSSRRKVSPPVKVQVKSKRQISCEKKWSNVYKMVQYCMRK